MAATEACPRRLRASSVALGVWLALCPIGRADHRVSAGTFVYTDADHLTVVHPEANAAISVTPDTKLTASYEADVISAATIDVRTSASPRGFHETRHGASVSIGQQMTRNLGASARYALSSSPDYLTHNAGVALQLEDDAKQAQLELQLNAARDSVGHVGDALPVGHVTVLGASLTAAWLLSRSAVFELAVGSEHHQGYLQSPYRFVTIYDLASAGMQRLSVSESVPEQRVRTALQARLRWALAERWFARGSVRIHGDDWGILGQTAELRFSYEPDKAWLLSVYGRAYAQLGASFYHGRYDAQLPLIPELRTRDRTLASSRALSGGAQVQWQLGAFDGFDFQLEARGELTTQHYSDTPLLPQRTALVLGASLVAQR